MKSKEEIEERLEEERERDKRLPVLKSVLNGYDAACYCAGARSILEWILDEGV